MPTGPPGQPRFVNAAVLLETDLSPQDLRDRVLRPIEAALGRRRNADRFAPRPIDLDLVAFGDRRVWVGGKTLPDPELATALHVLLPCAEVAPDLSPPGLGASLSELAQRASPRLPAGWRVRQDLAGFPDLAAIATADFAEIQRSPR